MFDEPWFDAFFSDGLVTDIVMQLKSGKEASVYVCRANPSTGARLVAAKAFRPRLGRGFKNDAAYTHGRSFGKHRENRAVRTKTRFGREVQAGAWIHREFEILRLLSDAGADVPRPLASCDWGILMSYVGDEEGPAPQLREVDLTRAEARTAFDRLLWNVEIFLANHTVHADLSPYNVLWWEDAVTVIDFPQAVDARMNHNSRELLERDLANLCRHFARYGITSDPGRLANGLWNKYLFARL